MKKLLSILIAVALLTWGVSSATAGLSNMSPVQVNGESDESITFQVNDADGDALFTIPDDGGIILGETPISTPGEGTIWYDDGANTLLYRDNAASRTISYSAATITLDEAYDNGETIDLDAAGDMEFDLTVTSRKVQIANTYAGTQAVALEIDAEAAQEITDAILFNTTAGTIVDAIDASDSSITNAINVGDNVIIGLAATIDLTDFDVSADGVVTLASDDSPAAMIVLSPSAAATTGLDASDGNLTNAISVGANTILGTTGNIDFTNFDVIGSSGNTTIGGTLGVTGNTTLSGDLTVSGTTNVNSGTWNTDAVVPAAVGTTLTLDGVTTGGVTIGATSTGDITLGDTVIVSDSYDMIIGEGSLTIDNDQNSEVALTITTDMTTTGNAIGVTANSATTGNVISITADLLEAGGKMLYLDSDGIPSGTYYIYAFDGSNDDFTVDYNGITTIEGVTSTDSLILTKGDIQITDGDIDLDSGFIAVNTAADQMTSVVRNQATTNMPVVEFEATNTGDDYPVLLLDQKATTGIDTLEITTDATADAIQITSTAAAATSIHIDVGDSMTGRALYGDLGPWLGTGGQGAIELITDAAAIVPAGQLTRLNQRGTGQHASAIAGSVLFINDEAAAPGAGTSYAVYIDGNNIEAMHVDTGDVLIDDNLIVGTKITVETIEINTLLDVDEDVDIDFDASDEEFVISSSADYGATPIVRIEDTYNGGAMSSQHWLLNLRYTRDGDANGEFLLCEDNAGDSKFTIAEEGNTTIEGTLTVNGAQIIGDGVTEMVGVKADVVDGAASNPFAITTAMSGTIFYNSQAIEFDLPEASTAIGCRYTFVVAHASNLDIDPEASDIFLGVCDAAGDKLRSTTVGDTITIVCIDATNWVVENAFPANTDWPDSN